MWILWEEIKAIWRCSSARSRRPRLRLFCKRSPSLRWSRLWRILRTFSQWWTWSFLCHFWGRLEILLQNTASCHRYYGNPCSWCLHWPFCPRIFSCTLCLCRGIGLIANNLHMLSCRSDSRVFHIRPSYRFSIALHTNRHLRRWYDRFRVFGCFVWNLSNVRLRFLQWWRFLSILLLLSPFCLSWRVGSLWFRWSLLSFEEQQSPFSAYFEHLCSEWCLTQCLRILVMRTFFLLKNCSDWLDYPKEKEMDLL